MAKLHERYRELGYAGARLSTDYDPERSADFLAKQVRLKVSVLERKRVDVSFQGNQRLDDGDLRTSSPSSSAGRTTASRPRPAPRPSLSSTAARAIRS
jgi:hypothetical protein